MSFSFRCLCLLVLAGGVPSGVFAEAPAEQSQFWDFAIGPVRSLDMALDGSAVAYVVMPVLTADPASGPRPSIALHVRDLASGTDVVLPGRYYSGAGPEDGSQMRPKWSPNGPSGLFSCGITVPVITKSASAEMQKPSAS